jgi:thymidine kinase
MELKTDRDFVEQLEITELAQQKYKVIREQEKEKVKTMLENEKAYIEVDEIKYYDERFVKKLLKL